MRRGFRARLGVALGAVLLVIGALLTPVTAAPAHAADLSQFDPGNIITDAVFFNSGAMSQAQIQSFLEGKETSCAPSATCVKNYYTVTKSLAADPMCGAYSGGYSERASAIISKVAQACGINPQVLLVTMQKEQGLITSVWPSDYAYAHAMGADCPDTTGCNSISAGFFAQVYKSAWQLKRYANPSGTSNYFTWYAPGHTWNIRYSPNAACGTKSVYVKNQATADLYYYTPYTPNAAALKAGYGTGDSCSAYGNRNFYNYFVDWFGSTQGATGNRSPFGGYNLLVERGQFTVQGWTLDPDQPATQLTVSLTIDGQPNSSAFSANAFRPDVGAAYPGYGDYHGMNATFEIAGGDHQVCVTVRNVGLGGDASFGCTSISVESASPQGGTSMETLPGGVHLTGWTLDLDTTDAIAVHVYVDGVGTAYVANAFRPDVGAVYPGYGDNHGIDIMVPLSVAKHTVCAYGINVGRGSNTLLGCYDVQVTQSGDPIGILESAFAAPGGVHVRGWAIDPNSTGSIPVHVYTGSAGTPLEASLSRDDLSSKYPASGTAHGFDAALSAPPGLAQVCAYGINTGFGANSLIGCKSVAVLSGSPFGGIDVAPQSGGVRLRGWTIDPDTSDPIPVHVYIDGTGRALEANVIRSDVGGAYPGYGSLHGIDATFDLSAGSHALCAYAINTGVGANALLGCASFVVPNGSPFGGTDATVSGGDVRLRGWTIDPDTMDPIVVHVYVDGTGMAVTTANVARPDVGAAYPGYGDGHGIDTTLTLMPGNHQICSYAINVGPGSNTLLACQTLTTR